MQKHQQHKMISVRCMFTIYLGVCNFGPPGWYTCTELSCLATWKWCLTNYISLNIQGIGMKGTTSRR